MHGGHQTDAMDDIMTLMHQSVVAMQRGEKIMVINSLCGHDELARACDRIGKGQPGKIMVYSAYGAKLREKFDFLSATIVARNIRMIVVNSFEFAAIGSRQKQAFAAWLRAMRDAHKLRIVVYSYERESPRQGALSGLSYVSNYVDKVGEWQREEVPAAAMLNATDVAESYADAVEQLHQQMQQSREAQQVSQDVQPANTAAIIPTNASTTGSGMTMPRREWERRRDYEGYLRRPTSLDINDLAPRGARTEPNAETTSDLIAEPDSKPVAESLSESLADAFEREFQKQFENEPEPTLEIELDEEFEEEYAMAA